ncbi:MAG: hypothetical protein IKQ60_04365 [Candidatus Methanomethylophilaceae archaeon]|nr:hypothetical protein [Candidatus Methanomethylophilaceae archaeon]
MGFKLIHDSHFTSERTEYEPGEPVEVVFPWIATDTDYQFYIDGAFAMPEYMDGRYVIRFLMPAHDTEVSYSSRNTMFYDPSARHDRPSWSDGSPLSENEWKCNECGQVNSGKFCSTCGSPRPKQERARSMEDRRRLSGQRRSRSAERTLSTRFSC